jgi:glycosidase
LVRKLIHLRHQQPQFREGNHFFYNHYDRYHSKNVLLFSRQHGNKFSLVALNFGDSATSVPFWFPIAGNYQEELDGQDNLINVPSLVEYWVTIPSNYGRIWTVTISS